MARAATKAAKEPLSAERIELAALEQIEAEGLDGFSTRKLAAVLGCEAMSIYHYFPSKAHLMDALVDRVMDEISVPDPEAADWRAEAENSGREWRAIGHRHPAFFGFLAFHRLNTPKALRWLNGMIGVFRNSGLDEEQAVRAFRSLGYVITGAILDETAGYARGHTTVKPVPDDEMAARYPHVVAAGKWFRESEWEATFEYGLRLMLDSIEVQRPR